MGMNREAGASQSGGEISPGVVEGGFQNHVTFCFQRPDGIYLVPFAFEGGVGRGRGDFQKAWAGSPSRDGGEIDGRIRIHLNAEIQGVRLVDLSGKQGGTEEGNSHITWTGRQGIRQLHGFGEKSGSHQEREQSELSEKTKKGKGIRIFHGRIVMVAFWVM
jgi:hypothetical protein